MLTLSFTLEEAQRLHQQYPSLSYRKKDMLENSLKEASMDAVVRVAEKTKQLKLQKEQRQMRSKEREWTGLK